MAFGIMEVPRISCPLDLSGFNAIHVGIWDPKRPATRPCGNAVKIKLSDVASVGRDHRSIVPVFLNGLVYGTEVLRRHLWPNGPTRRQDVAAA